MTKKPMTSDEILAIEKAADDRRQNRRNGFELMDIRDQGWHRLSNGVTISWHTPKPTGDNYIWRYIPEGTFELQVNGEKILFDAEEFRRWLRWA